MTTSPDLSAQPLMALAGCWDMRQGDHPHLAGHLKFLATQPLFPSPEGWSELSNLHLPLMLATHGHHVVRDASYLAATGTTDANGNPQADEFPLAPMFVRDLCGRIIHTGLVPLPSPPQQPLFPTCCLDVPATASGAEYIENALFFTLRRLEVAPTSLLTLAGTPRAHLRAAYPHPSNYPYKLRPDTFYQDGWRLPQIPRVFARNVPQPQAQAAAAEFMSRWQSRPKGQDYEAFYEANNGAAWFEEFFTRGVTIIPTLEAYNGRYQVNDDYTLAGVDAGRAIPGLHQVISQQASPSPAGTILQVVQPGYVTTTQVTPAQVITSDGSGFTPPSAPQPQLPNLKLPHPHLSSQWGAVWLPTHPQHFAEPALWDWDTSGHFVQISGPLWCPLHYTYSSVPIMVRALRKPLEGNPCLYILPESLRQRFHPIIAQNWYDTISEATAQQRQQNAGHPLCGSALDALPLGQSVATIGYHPLPAALHYALDPALFPQLHPRHRVPECPSDFASRLAPVTELTVDSAKLATYHIALSEPMREALMQSENTLPPQIDFLQANVSSGTHATQLTLQSQAAPAFLPHLPTSQLLINVKRLFAARSYRQSLQKQSSNLAEQLFAFREAGLSWRRLRYRLFTKYPAAWVQAWAQGLDLETAENRLPTFTPEQHEQIIVQRESTLTATSHPSTSVPAVAAAGLRSAAKPSKLRSAKA